MSELIVSWLVLAAEAALGLSVLMIIISTAVVIRRKRRINTAESMTEQLISSAQRNQQDLRFALKGSEEYEQLELEERILALNNQEKRLYDRILAIFRGGKSGLIEGVSEDVGALLNASKALYTPSKRSLKKERSANKALVEVGMALKKENQALKQELLATKRQMAQLKSEYSAIYNRMK
jgi:hypothetical protein